MLTREVAGWRPLWRAETEEERDERQWRGELVAAQREMRESAPEGTVFLEDFTRGMAAGMESGLSAFEAFLQLAGAVVVVVEAEEGAAGCGDVAAGNGG